MNTENNPVDGRPDRLNRDNAHNTPGEPKGRIFITGSTDGLGFLAAKTLIEQGYSVVLHARDEKRKEEVLQKLPAAKSVVIADLSDLEATKGLAAEVNKLAPFEAVIHNAGVYRTSSDHLLKVNLLAPYILTCQIEKPKRLIYLCSNMYVQGNPKLKDIVDSSGGNITYSDTKLDILLLTKAISQKWTGVYSNAVDPGWVPTKMGGAGAPDDLREGYTTQVWLATSADEKAKVTGRYFHHMKEQPYNKIADDVQLQQQFLEACRKATGVSLPQ